ncbi:putative MFS family arabinose efflux permease [Nocardioides albertanoniae]|uniref:Putative MFS family arabinose efflux permease n=1 Tax=Nocardioides albertanoniae TaxID=1175486 RepID=A0A543AC38_9ACTN|nr:MFS transporter [Nocardioides albertanoniae]TQL70165.1 putative MFS family arabinose efflux permease [Nocardioides albertanoniae]
MTTLDPVRTRGGVLRHRDFRLLAAGGAISMIGNGITPVALAFAVIDLGGGAAELGLVVASFATAEVMATLLGGVLGDRFSRKVMMEGTSAASAVVQVVLAVMLIGGFASIPALTVAGVVTGVLGALNRPSSQAMTRFTVPAEEVAHAVPARALANQVGMTVGYALGGVLVSVVGAGWSIMIDAATFAVAAVCFALMRVAHVRPEGARVSMLADLGEGAREVLRHTWLWLLIIQALLYHLFYGGAQGVLGPIVVGEGMSRSAWGVSLAVMMAGFVVGGLICLRWRPRRMLYVGAALLSLTALFPIAMAVAEAPAVVWGGAFLHGVGLSIFSVFWDLAIQQQIPEDKLSRVYSFDIVGSFIARPVGLAVTGPVAAAVGFAPWLLVVAAVIGGSSLIALLSRDVRVLQRLP